MDGKSFIAAAKAIDLAKVKVLLDVNPNLINGNYKEGLNLLHWAACGGNKDVAEFLLAKGADVNAKDNRGYSPLHWAAVLGHKDVVLLLLANGADGNATTGFFRDTPLHMAANKEVAELLLASGTEVNAKSGFFTPLERAALYGRKDVVEFLFTQQANINTRNHFYGFTPLHWAALRGHKDVAEFLLAKGADVNSRGIDGSTPLHAAVSMYYSHHWPTDEVMEQSRKDVVLLLLAKGAHINATDNCGETPLYMAARDGHKHIVKLLRQHGARSSIITTIFYGLRNVFH